MGAGVTGTATIGYENVSEYNEKFSANEKQENTNSIGNMSKELAANSQTNANDQTNSNSGSESKTVSESLTISIGESRTMTLDAGDCKHGFSFKTFKLGEGVCYQEVHFSASKDQMRLKGQELEDFANIVMPQHGVVVLQDSDVGVWMNTLTVGGLIGNE